MPYEIQDDPAHIPSSHFLSAAPRKSPSRPSNLNSINNRRSSASLRPPAMAHAEDDDDPANGRYSLAHELAVALMPEPSAGSKLLAEEFGIEYDEGAEGIDPQVHIDIEGSPQFASGPHTPSFADELSTSASPFHNPSSPLELHDVPPELDETFGNPFPSSKQRKSSQPPQQDALEILAQDLKSTDNFLVHLRSIDVDAGSSSTQSLTLERLASDIIRKIDNTVRDREGQVRELLGYEREFRRIVGEVGGNDALSYLDELPQEDLSDDTTVPQTSRVERHALDVVQEEEPLSPRRPGYDWETDPDRLHDDDDDDNVSIASPVKQFFPPPPPVNGHPTPAKTIPQLAHFRSFTTSLVTSLTMISEQAQVNGAATTEAGRKIRALKNKLGDWRTEWDSAERSRARIDKWEAGILDKEGDATPPTPTYSTTSKRMDGRIIVQEHLRAFEIALADAAMKTQAIMAAA